ncbi:transposable element Tcb1 transposase [Trichonephila clavipes]|nr:transposable element Tcb1 transposase [Trichonephila clavipes]
MTIVFVCGDPVVNASPCLCFTATHCSHSWCDGIGCHYLQYTVNPSIDPWHHDSPVVRPKHSATTCVATYAMAPRSPFSTRQCSASHSKGVTRLSPHWYYPSLAYTIPTFVSNRAYLGSFGTANWASHEFERTRGKVTANMERNVSRYHTERVCLNSRSYRIVRSR